MGDAIRILTGILLGAGLASPALATSDAWHRFPAMAGVGQCGSGLLVEQVEEGGSVTYAHASVLAACMTAPTKADWVMVSAVQCGDGGSYKPDLCDSKPSKGPMVRIREIARYAEEDRRSIKLERATIGRDCGFTPAETGTSWSCRSYEDVKDLAHGVAAGRFRSAQGRYEVKLFGKPVELPLTFDRKAAMKALPTKAPAASAPAPVEPDYPHWMGEGRHIAYGPPETDAEAALNCVSPGRVELSVFDPMKGPRPFRSTEGYVMAVGVTELAYFRVHDTGDGDRLVFSIPVDGLALARLSAGKDFIVRVPTGETVTVPGTGAEKAAASLMRACARPVRQATPSSPLPVMRMP